MMLEQFFYALKRPYIILPIQFFFTFEELKDLSYNQAKQMYIIPSILLWASQARIKF